MTLLNVELLGLSGRSHPALQNIFSTQGVRKLRAHLKFLSGDFFTAERAAKDQSGLNPSCTLCGAETESVTHIIAVCRALSGTRDRILPELMNTTARVQPLSRILEQPSPSELTQFILDCTSINLDESIRVPSHNKGTSDIFRVSRDLCFAITNERLRLQNNRKRTK